MSVMFGCFRQEPGQLTVVHSSSQHLHSTNTEQMLTTWSFLFEKNQSACGEKKNNSNVWPHKLYIFMTFHSCKLLVANTLRVLPTTHYRTRRNLPPPTLPTPDPWPPAPPVITSCNKGRFTLALTAGNDTRAGWEVTLRSKARCRQRPRGPAAGGTVPSISHRVLYCCRFGSHSMRDLNSPGRMRPMGTRVCATCCCITWGGGDTIGR